MQSWTYMVTDYTIMHFLFVFFPYRQDIKELKEELSKEKSQRTALQVSGDAAKE